VLVLLVPVPNSSRGDQSGKGLVKWWPLRGDSVLIVSPTPFPFPLPVREGAAEGGRGEKALFPALVGNHID
jgi:hypothetical protein